jgi:molecular chaperone GrpE (heat shock protein)
MMQAIKRAADGQEAIRTAVLQEIGQLRSDVAGELTAQSLRSSCRDLSSVLAALEDMLERADFSDGATIRQHVESLALTLGSAMSRMGIDRMPIIAGTDLFDSRIHECVRVCGHSDSPFPAAPSRTIVRVQEPGFLVRGRVAMPAKVWVQKTELNKIEPEKDGL